MNDIGFCGWKSLPKNINRNLHSICSYMAMFPANLPHFFIEKHSKEGETVLDPFSGRGTTVLEACFMNRKGIGNDKNILAYVLTKSKADVPQKSRIISRLNELENVFDPKKIDLKGINPNIRMIFSNFTLKQLLFLRDRLKWRKSNIDTFITSMILGIMHGNSEGFLSLSMPNTFSMAPNYIKNFVEEHKLKKPNRNAFELLKRKLDRCYQKPCKKGKVFNQDVTKMTKIKDNSIDLIITSPPYTRVIRYGQFNWIRLWFLDKNAREIDEKLFFSQSKEKYSDFMLSALKEMKRVLKSDKKIVLVIGDVKDRVTGKPFNLAGLIWKSCAKPLGFKLTEPIQQDIVGDDSKVSKIWGDKKGRATKIERILVLQKTD